MRLPNLSLKQLILLISLLVTLLFANGVVADGPNPLPAGDSPPTIPADPANLPQLLGQLYPATAGRPPIILVHGWQGMNFDKADCDDTDPNDPDFNYVDENWDQIDEEFEAMGFFVEYVRSKSGSSFSEPNCSPVAEENAPQVALAIDRALADPRAQGQTKVVLVAHSMGGLVSRAYLESDLYRGDVVALFTLGTPHVGVPVNVLSTWVEVLTLGAISLDDYCIAQPVVCQFSDNEASNPPGFSGIETFNAVHSERAAGVYYHLLGGDIGFDDRSLVTCDPLYLLIPGLNDCIVPLPSAMGAGSADGSLGPLSGTIDRLQVYAAHIESFNDDPSVPGTCQYRHNFHNKDEYCVTVPGFAYLNQSLPSSSMGDCLAPVIDNRLADHVCGTVGQLAYQTQAPAGRTSSQRHYLPAGQSASRIFAVEGGRTLFSVYHQAGLKVYLIDPAGQLLDAAYAQANPQQLLFESRPGNGTAILLPQATPGQWQLVMEATNDEAVTALSLMTAPSTATVQLTFDKGSYRPGETVTLTATVQGATQAQLTATLSAGPLEQVLNLVPAGDNQFAGSFTAPSRPGYGQVTVQLTGQVANGIIIEQQTVRLLPISAETIRLTGSYSHTHTANGDLLVSVGVTVDSAGRYGLAADLLDQTGQIVAHNSHLEQLPAGDNSLTIRFPNVPAGTLTLANLRLTDYAQAALPISLTNPQFTISNSPIFTPNPQSRTLPQSPTANSQSCSLSHLGPYLPGQMVNVTCDVTLQDQNSFVEWLDGYFLNGPDGWDIISQSSPPADAGGWNQPTTAIPCNQTGLSYWGVANGHLDGLNPCDLSLNNLPTSGSYNGPWLAVEGNDVTFGPESFEAAQFPPAGWHSWNTDGDNYNTGWQRSNSQAQSGSYSAFHNDDSTCFFCTGDIESWLVLPLRTVRAGDQLVWWQQLRGSASGFSSDFDVWLSQDSNDPNSDDFVELFNLTYSASGQWTGWYFDLSNYTGKQIYIAFRYLADDDEELYLDNIYVRNQHIQTVTYQFAATYQVDGSNSCPGSPYVGLSSDPSDARSGLAGVAMGDLVAYSLDVAGFNAQSACPLPAVTLLKTVSTNGSCPGSSVVTVPAGSQTVTYCYQVQNNSSDNVTLSDYLLTDTAIGLSNFAVPGQTIPAGQTALIYQTNYSHNIPAGQCLSSGASVSAYTPTGLGQPQGSPANVPFSDIRYIAQHSTAANATQVCVIGDTGYLSPAANAAQTGGDHNGFELTPANAYADDGLFAQDMNSGTGPNTACTNGKKDKQLFYNYGISLPAGAIVNGIEVRLDAKVDNPAGTPKLCVQLSGDGGATWTTAKSTTTLTTNEASYILGGSSDSWGNNWDNTKLGNTPFRLRIVAVSSDLNRDFSLDWAAVRVYYAQVTYANTGFVAPTANLAGSGGDGNGLQTNPANGYADDGLFAIDPDSGTTTSTNCTNAGKDSHIFYGFDLSSVPAGATIKGIELRLDAKADGGSGAPKLCIQLSTNGGATWTTAQATPTLTTSEATYLLGGPNNLWGQSWNTASLANIRVRVIMVASNLARDFSLDVLLLKVHYE